MSQPRVYSFVKAKSPPQIQVENEQNNLYEFEILVDSPEVKKFSHDPQSIVNPQIVIEKNLQDPQSNEGLEFLKVSPQIQSGTPLEQEIKIKVENEGENILNENQRVTDKLDQQRVPINQNNSSLTQNYDLMGEEFHKITSKEKLQKYWLIYSKISPPFIAILEQYTIINYYISQDLEHSIKDICFAVIVFTPILMVIVKFIDLFKSFTEVERDNQICFRIKKKKKIDDRKNFIYLQRASKMRDAPAYGQISWSQIRRTFLDLIFYLLMMVCFITQLTLSTLLKLLCISPLLAIECDIKYPISQNLITELSSRKHLFEHQKQINQLNDEIKVNNQKSQLHKEFFKKNNYPSNNKLPIRQLLS